MRATLAQARESALSVGQEQQLRRELAAVRAECIVLRDEKAHLQAKFEASQALADEAIKDRDEWQRAALEADREITRLVEKR